MNQRPLLRIRKRPVQPDLVEYTSRQIRAYVREKLRGFTDRQRARERRRREYQERFEKQFKEETPMKTIRITFRGIFEGPKGVLNPMGIYVPGHQPVEIFKYAADWKVREISTPARREFTKLGKFATHTEAMRQTEESFHKMVEAWQPWGIAPAENNLSVGLLRRFTESEIRINADGTAGWYTAQDHTHIIHPPLWQASDHLPTAACGAEGLTVERFVNNRANIQPTCPGCAEVWRKEYKGK